MPWTADEFVDFGATWVPCGGCPAYGPDGRCVVCGVSEESTWDDDGQELAHPLRSLDVSDDAMAFAPVTYFPDLCAAVGDPDEMFERLMGLNWTRLESVPRDEIYFNDTDAPYTYGSGEHARTYYPYTTLPWPITAIRNELEGRLGCVLDVCFLNRYMTARDQLGWHSDDSPEMDPDRPIVTVSLGSEREIRFRPRCTCGQDPHTLVCHKVWGEEGRLLLEHGSAAVMRPGMQQRWQHRIPKSSRSEVGPRISLTFRGYLPEERA